MRVPLPGLHDSEGRAGCGCRDALPEQEKCTSNGKGSPGGGAGGGPLVRAEGEEGSPVSKQETDCQGGRLSEHLLMFMEQKSRSSGQWGRQSQGGGGRGTCFPKSVDARTSFRQGGDVQCWATKLCLAYSFLKFNPNSCSEDAVIKAVCGIHLGGRHTTNGPSKI